jgi:hypothetical protein
VTPKSQSPALKFVFALLLILIVAGLVEIGAFITYQTIKIGFFAPNPTLREFADELAAQSQSDNFDARLGWRDTGELGEYDARTSPDNLSAWSPCVSLYGDSYIYGLEASPEKAWGNQLAKQLKCKVLNFAVQGYGADQAYLKFSDKTSDPSKLAILGVVSENIVRNVNQNRAFIYPAVVGPLKPRFRLDDAHQLELVPMPTINASSYDDYIHHPERLFPYEFFIPGSSLYAQQRVGFPYSVRLLLGLRYKRIYDSLLFYIFWSRPWFADFYDPAHSSRAFEVTSKIIDRFVSDAKRREKVPIVMFVPTSRDVGNFLVSNQWVYQGLVQKCLEAGYNCFDAGTAMVDEIHLTRSTAGGFCQYFCTSPLTYSGHYTDKGYALLADVTAHYLGKFMRVPRDLSAKSN